MRLKIQSLTAGVEVEERCAVGPFHKSSGSSSTSSQHFAVVMWPAANVQPQATHPSQCRYDNPHENSEHYDSERDLNPQAKVPNRSLDAVSPGVW
jgi:hypothetical protein